MIFVINANATRCRLYHLNKNKTELSFYKEISHPENRLKTSELTSDKSGRYQNMNGGKSAYSPHMDAKEVKVDEYLREIAHELNQERNQNPLAQLIIVAPPHLSGLLQQHCNKHVKEQMTKVIQKDLMHLSDLELMEYLKEAVKYPSQ